jgi:type IV pilus assembly protein PilY1
MKVIHQVKAVVAGLILSSAVVPVATAEDIEIYTSLGANGNSSNPNIMFMVDTSGSMGAKSKVKESYNASTSYTGSCERDGIYFVSDGKLPICTTSTDWFHRVSLVCDHATVGYTGTGLKITPPQDGALLMIGTFSDQLAQYDSVKNRWRGVTVGTSADRNYMVECFSDSGIHGSGTGNAGDYIDDGGTGFTSTVPADPKVPHQVWSGGAGNLQLYDGNYVNYLNDATVPLVEKTYLEQVQAAVEIMVRGNTRVDIGLMRFDKNSQGGPVLYPILDVGADRNDFFSRLKTLKAESWTPLSEVYYEALLYFGGRKTDFGQTSTPSNQVGSTYTSGGKKFYNSPISSECDKNYIVMLSDGQPTRDDVSATRQAVLPGFNVGSCNTTYTSDEWDDNKSAFNSDAATDDNCMDELSAWGFTQDVVDDDAGKPETKGAQNVVTHTIGFQLGDAGGIQLMKDTARKGGGTFYEADSEAKLIAIFNLIIASALQVNSTFSSPAVSVNAFNRSTHLDDLYFTLFKPSEGNHWNGNLKKYKLEFEVDSGDKDGDGDITERLPFIADQTSTAAVPVHAVDNKTGFFSDTSKSYWTTGAADGKEVSKGGAASVLTNTRNVYTTTGTYAATGGVNVPPTTTLTSSVNAVDNANTALTDALLGITGYPEIVTGTPYRETLLNWAAGRDALSQFGTANTYTDARTQMGDPLHAQPALVQYGGTPTNPDLVAYVATNDGYLHAFDADDGKEIFSFIPQESLPKLSVAMEDLGGGKLYGLDGSVVAWINDINKDGIINGADHVYLYVSQRRGGRNIYALDVTSRTKPELLWVIKGGTGEYTELGDTWSTVNVEKIKQGSTEKTVLMFGGGYDRAQDATTVRSPDAVGRSIYIADARTGKRLWSGGKDGATPTAEMEYSIPGRVKPLDISGDGFIDRIYAVDVGGQVFRFDIDNTNGAVLSSSITGERIADLADTGVENARRFYYPPDVALIGAKDGKYHALALSSGYRAHPLDTAVHDRIYMLKDRNTGLIDSGYTTLIEGNLHDATDNLAGGDGVDAASRDAELASIQGKEGWYVDLEDENNPGTWLGEKGLAEPLILEGQVILTTYTPNVFSATNSCEPNIGLGKVFFMDILDATPSFPSNIDKRAQRHIELARGGIPPAPNVIITKGGVPTLCIGTECSSADLDLGVRKTYWYEVEK